MSRREQKLLKILRGFTDGVIQARRKELSRTFDESIEPNCVRKQAMLDFFLKSTINGEPLSEQELRESVDGLIFAGHDSTSSAISFCLYNIAKYPEVQRKILEEVRSVIQPGEKITSNQLNDLKYLDLVIKESLRLFPPAPFFSRKLSEQVTAGGYTLPKGSSVAISPFLMGRDPKLFQNPLDFIPERFDTETTSEKVNSYAYVPFSAGPKGCIGQKFAVLEIKSVLSLIVSNFEISLKSQDDLDLYSALILKAENGIHVIFKGRRLN